MNPKLYYRHRTDQVPRYFLDDKECREEIEDKQHKIDHCRACPAAMCLYN